MTLDNKLYQAYETIAEENNISVADAMREGLRLLSLHFRKESKSPTRKRLENRVDELRCLPSNWDCAGAPVISRSACDETLDVLAACSDELLQGLAIFPNVNGYVLMQWKTPKGDACLSIMADRMAYDVSCGGEEKDGILPLSEIHAFVDILKNIA